MTIKLYFDTGDIRDVPTWEQDPAWRRNTVSSTLSIEDESGSRSFTAWTYSFGLDPLYELAGATPALDQYFSADKSLVDRISGNNLITFTRASTGTYVGADGLIKTATTDEPRFTHDPVTLECLGLLVEGARTNLLLNSATLSTQGVTVTATAHTLSFTGTGTVTLSGASTAGPLVGTGTGEANRVSLTFTPSAGTLTLTVSGTVSNAQLEAGGSASSYIPTTSAAVPRAADVASITGTNFTSWYNAAEGTLYADAIGGLGAADSAGILGISDGTLANGILLGFLTTTLGGFVVYDGGASQAEIYPSVTENTRRVAGVYAANDFAVSYNGAAASTDVSGTVPTVNQLTIDQKDIGASINGPIARIAYWPERLPNANLQAMTSVVPELAITTLAGDPIVTLVGLDNIVTL